MLLKTISLLFFVTLLFSSTAARDVAEIRDLFNANADANSWSSSPPGLPKVVYCPNSRYSTLGGYINNGAMRPSFWKDFAIPQKHIAIRIRLRVVGYSSVDGCTGNASPDYYRIYANGALVHASCGLKFNNNRNPTHCQGYKAKDFKDVFEDITITFVHSSNVLSLRLQNDANEPVNNEAYGFANMIITIIDGPEDCEQAADEGNCARCHPSAQLINRRCNCPAGTQRLTGNPVTCSAVCPPSCAQCNNQGGCIACAPNAAVRGTSCQCNAGYFQQNAAPLQCNRCHAQCGACTGPNPNQCTSCPPGAVLSGSTCICPAGSIRVGDACAPCHGSCATCSGPADNQCQSCKPGLVFGGGRCFSCHGRCASCNGPADTNCLSCAGNAVLRPFGGGSQQSCFCNDRFYALSYQPLQCIPCAASCAKCERANSCTECSTGAVLANSICVCPSGTYQTGSSPLTCGKCHPSCAACSGPNPNQCTQCALAGQALTGGTCASCNPVCLTCSGTGSNQCLSCRAPSVLQAAPGGNTCACPAESYGELAGGILTCRKCDPTCRRCTGKQQDQCSECYPGGVLVNNRCDCPSGQYLSGLAPFKCAACHPNCASCTGFGDNQCKTCAPGLSQNGARCFKCDPTCVTCSDIGPNACKSCGVGAILTTVPGGQTCKCPVMHQPDPVFPPLKCVKFECSPTCSACTGPHRDQCTACKDGFVLEAGQCRQKVCDKTCQQCTNDPKMCTSCNAGANLVGGKCECKPGYFRTAPDAPACDRCHKSCATCSLGTACLTCPPNSVLGADKTCQCASGFYSNPIAETLQCLPCSSSCATCSTERVCITCKGDLVLVNGQCQACHESCATCQGNPNNCKTCRSFAILKDVPQPGGAVFKTCACQDGFTAVAGKPGTCESCKAPCKTCSEATTMGCLSCNPDAFYVSHPKGGECRCNAGLYLDGAGRCQKCDISCAKCNGPAATNCIECQPGVQLVNGVCVKCHPTCSTCSGGGDTQCTSCPKNSNLVTTKTGDTVKSQCKCNPGFWQAPGGCLACNGVCKTCIGSEANQCDSCPTNSELVNNPSGGRTCSCIAGYFASSLNPLVCSRCDSSCKTCSGGASNQCTSCSSTPTQSLVNGRCVKCDPKCTGCTDESPKGCNQCAPNAELVVLQPNGMTCKCRAGFASETEAPLRCQPYACHASCATCNGPKQSQCITCPAGFQLSEGFCKLPVCADDCLRCRLGADNKTVCTECTDGAALTDGKCSCKVGYFKAATKDLKCTKCPSGCTKCSSESQCEACVDNAEPVNGKCTCKAKFFSLPESVFTCHRCHVSCATCKGAAQDNCLTCEAGLTLANGKCIKCSPICATCNGEGDFKCTSAGPNARLVDVPQGKTVECLPTFYSKARDPFKCEKYVCHASCAECKGPNANDCTSCKPGQKLSSGNCVDIVCSPNCKTCDSVKTDQCKSCVEGAVVNAKQQCECTDEFEVVGVSPLKCTKFVCHRTCKTCKGRTEKDCKTCIDGAEGPAAGVCKCKDGAFLTGSECKKCHDTCLTCSGQNFDECLTCKPGDQQVGKKCIKCDSSCQSCNAAGPNGCTACKAGNFELKDVEGGKACKCKAGYSGTDCKDFKCHESCGTCDGPAADKCTSCKAPLVPNGKSCQKPSCHSSCADCFGARDTECTVCPKGAILASLSAKGGRCDAAEGFYKKTDKDGKVTFEPCDSSCKTCSSGSKTSCLSCYSKGIIKDGQCVCDEGWFLVNGPKFSCETCHPSCKTCTGAAKTCTSCHFGANLANNTCFTCDKACAQCSGPAGNQCTKCTSKASLVPAVGGGQTCQCPSGSYISDSNPLACNSCNGLCVTCNGPTENQCVSCAENAVLKPASNSGGSTCACKDGFIAASTSPLRCVSLICDKSCAKCSGPQVNQCTECPAGARLVSGKCEKIQCHAKCATCDGTGENQCLSCTANGRLSDMAGGKTCTCASGYFSALNPALSCTKCADGCKTCEGKADFCTSCEGHGVAKNGKCSCPEGEYLVSEKLFTCAACHTACKGCTGAGSDKCIACAAGFVQNNSSCFKCHSSCTNCNGPAENQCTNCTTGATLKEGKCACSNGTLPNDKSATLKCDPFQCDESCATCKGPHKNQCLTCKPNLTKTIDGYCRTLTCHKSCLTCTGPTENDCIKCNTGADLDQSSIKSVCKCRKGYYTFTANPVYCKECDPSCEDCESASTCKTCPANSSPNGAKCACKDGFYNSGINGKVVCTKCDANCKKCSGAGVCTECADKLTLARGQCITCHETCATCRGPGPNDCLSCVGSASLTDIDGGKQCKCATGTYRSSTNATQCKPCHSSCVSCSGSEANQCTRCDETAILKDGSCQCKEQQFPLATKPTTCGKCHSSCQSCKGDKATECLSCVAGRKFVNGMCSQCDQSCDTCSGPTAKECLSCRDGAELTADKQCKCKLGFFASSADPLTCVMCFPTCRGCNGLGEDKCTACSTGQALVNGRCQCGDGTFAASKSPSLVCQSCDSTCATCSGAGSNQCTSCKAGQTLVNSTRCITCDPTCATCSAEGPNGCETCPPNAGIVEEGGKKWCKCNKNFASKFKVPLKCEAYQCHSSCNECDGPEPNNCLSCKANLEYDKTARICKVKDCSANCVTCNPTNTTECKSCTAGATLTNGVCSCKVSFFQANSSPLICKECHKTCIECNGDGPQKCTKCPRNAKLTSLNACECMPGFFPGTGSLFSCHRCHASCETCNGAGADKCQTCLAPRKKTSDGRCVLCHPICANCNGETDSDCVAPAPNNAELVPKGSGLTAKCKSGFYSKTAAPLDCQPYTCHATCDKCKGPDANHCESCKNPKIKVTDGKCLSPDCHPNCLTCDGSGDHDCLSCTPGAKLATNVTAHSNCVCSPGFALTKAQPLACEKIVCHKTCATCNGPSSADCTSCPDTALAASTTTPTKCNCKDGLYLGANGCAKCHESCVTCSGPNYNECTKCKAGEKLLDGKCTKCHESCTDCVGPNENQCVGGCTDPKKVLTVVPGGKSCQCPKGYSGANCSVVACDSPCKSCDKPNECTSCVTDFVLSGKTCVKPNCHASCQSCEGSDSSEQKCLSCIPGGDLLIVTGFTGKCVAKSGYYRNDSVADGKQKVSFEKCHSSCKLCKGGHANECDACFAGAELTTEKSCKCLSGYFQSSASPFICTTCHASCATCKGSGSSECLTCKAGLTLTTTGKCVKCDSACLECSDEGRDKCTKCSEGAQLTSIDKGFTCTCQIGSVAVSTGPLKCSSCDSSCSTCTATEKCTGCGSGAVRKDDKCVCPEGTQQITSKPVTCSKPCPENCVSCQNDKCTSCVAGFTLKESKCVKSECNKKCETCSGPGENECESCAKFADLVEKDGGKTCSCKKGYKPQEGSAGLVCDRIKCDDSCKLCTAPNDPKTCVECWRNAVLTPTNECDCPFAKWPEEPTLCSETFVKFNEEFD